MASLPKNGPPSETSPLLGEQIPGDLLNGNNNVENGQNESSVTAEPKPEVDMRLFLPAVGIGVSPLSSHSHSRPKT